MAIEKTNNLKLNMPTKDEYYDLKTWNANSLLLDEEAGRVRDELESKESVIHEGQDLQFWCGKKKWRMSPIGYTHIVAVKGSPWEEYATSVISTGASSDLVPVLATANAHIKLLPGQYQVNVDNVVIGNGTRVEGSGMNNTSIISASNNSYNTFLKVGYGASLSDAKVNFSADAAGRILILFEDISDGRYLERVHVNTRGTGAKGVLLRNSERVSFHDCIFTGVSGQQYGNTAITTENQNGNFFVQGCSFNGSYIGISSANTAFLSINDCMFSNVNSPISSYYDILANISGNVFYNCGVCIDVVTNISSRLTITKNLFKSNYESSFPQAVYWDGPASSQGIFDGNIAYANGSYTTFFVAVGQHLAAPGTNIGFTIG